MGALNLDPDRKSVEALMVDICQIDSDPKHLTDAVLDMDTLQLVPNAANDTKVYGGACLLWKKRQQRQPNSEETAGLDQRKVLYVLAIPWNVNGLRIGQAVKMLRSQDASVTGMVGEIVDVERGTIQVWRLSDVEFTEQDRA